MTRNLEIRPIVWFVRFQDCNSKRTQRAHHYAGVVLGSSVDSPEPSPRLPESPAWFWWPVFELIWFGRISSFQILKSDKTMKFEVGEEFQTIRSRNMRSEHDINLVACTRQCIFDTKTILGEILRFVRFQDDSILKSDKPDEKNNSHIFRSR